MTKALAFFGAFNPPTAAHLGLAEFALRQTGREQAVFVPSKSVYIRDEQGKDFAYPDARRLRMLEKAAQTRPWMKVSDWEMRQPRQPRSYETLCHLREEGVQASLLFGSDKLPELEHGWLHVREIAEEFGFATAPLVTLGCCMMRVCNLDTCPVGVATQNPDLRCRFKGKPEYVMNFMLFIAEQLRTIMARLGVRSVEELVGCKSVLKRREDLPQSLMDRVCLDTILGHGNDRPVHFNPDAVYDFKLEDTKDLQVLLPEFRKSIKSGKPKTVKVRVSSVDRTFGTIVGSEITKQKGTLPDDTLNVEAEGGGGQSFGAFIPQGMTIRLTGDCNDYFGKGLSGGRLIVRPPEDSPADPGENIIIGNVALYGATKGEAFISGIAGERFCVRNSGARAVVEGVGDHGCEYMTGGCVVVLGSTGKNFAAGMSGGVAYVLDEKHELYLKLNKEYVTMTEVTSKYDIAELKDMIQRHVKETGSPRGTDILEHWEEKIPLFKKIMPNDYSRMLAAIGRWEEKGLTRSQAELEAFNEIRREEVG